MTSGKERIGLILGLAGAGLLGWAMFGLFTATGCVQIGYQEMACPTSGLGVLALVGGILLNVVGMLMGGGAIAFAALFLAIGLSALVPTILGMMPDMQLFGWLFGGIFTLCGLLPFGLMLVGGRMLAGKQAMAEDLMQRGTKAVGTIVEVKDTGVSLNDNPRVIIRMRVAPLDGAPPVERTKTVVVPRVAIPRAGERYPVWYDRNEPDKWMFGTAMEENAPAEVRDMFARARAAGEAEDRDGATEDSAVGELATLTGLWKDGALTDAEFAEAKARLLPRIGR